MPRYCCVFTPETAAVDRAQDLCVPIPGGGVEVAYEFDAPDLTALTRWLRERGIAPASVTAVEENAARRNPIFLPV